MKSPQYIATNCSSALNKLKRKIPYGWDLNIFRGCEHGCRYCFAMYSHKYFESDDFFGDIYVKINIHEQLEKELSSPKWAHEVVNIGGVTDSYQNAEAQYKLMPDILRLLIKYKTPAIISTKSDLILRDFDLIDELSRITYINIAATITTADPHLQSLVEPGAVSPERRFKVLREFRATKASTGLHLMPIMPLLTDSRENIDTLFSQAAECSVDYVLPGTLYLRGQTRTCFLSFIRAHFPHLYNDYLILYRTGGASKDYKDELYKMVSSLREKYRLSSSYTKPMKDRLAKAEIHQLSLFD